MLVKYIVMLYFMSLDCNYSLSIRKEIELARKYLNDTDLDICSTEHISTLCPNDHSLVCSTRLHRRKIQFKEFHNMCYMDLTNICEAQDSIWTIKQSGRCEMNSNLRRFANQIEQMVDGIDNNSTEIKGTDGDDAMDQTDDGTTIPDEETADETETPTEDNTLEDATEVSTKDEITEDIKEEETTIAGEIATDETAMSEDEATVDEIGTTDADDYETVTDTPDDVTTDAQTISEDEITTVKDYKISDKLTDTGYLNVSNEEIGKIYFPDGSVKPALRESTNTRFPPMRGVKLNWQWNVKCANRVKPCPNMYYPVCLFNDKEEPNNITYYYFINLCEAQQYSCYHPERKINGSSTVRAGFCAHIQYINYARYAHTMSAWGHYGWLRGPWRFNHILKPSERG